MSEDIYEHEIWKDVKGYEGMYQVSNLGRVKSLDRYVNSGYGKQRLHRGKILKPKLDKDGYLDVGTRVYGEAVHFRPHREMAIAFIPNPENKPQVNHIDFDKTNNSIENLEWSTPQEQIAHNYKNKKHAHGERQHKAKLTETEVIELRQSFRKGKDWNMLAEEYGITPGNVWFIVHDLTWKHLLEAR